MFTNSCITSKKHKGFSYKLAYREEEEKRKICGFEISNHLLNHFRLSARFSGLIFNFYKYFTHAYQISNTPLRIPCVEIVTLFCVLK